MAVIVGNPHEEQRKGCECWHRPQLPRMVFLRKPPGPSWDGAQLGAQPAAGEHEDHERHESRAKHFARPHLVGDKLQDVLTIADIAPRSRCVRKDVCNRVCRQELLCGALPSGFRWEWRRLGRLRCRFRFCDPDGFRCCWRCFSNCALRDSACSDSRSVDPRGGARAEGVFCVPVLDPLGIRSGLLLEVDHAEKARASTLEDVQSA